MKVIIKLRWVQTASVEVELADDTAPSEIDAAVREALKTPRWKGRPRITSQWARRDNGSTIHFKGELRDLEDVT